MNHAWMETAEPFDDAQLERMRKLRRILRFLAEDKRIAHMRDRIVVFGSAAAGKPLPGDIDVHIDFADLGGGIMHPSAIEASSLLLAVGRQFYGSFDPFVLAGPYLYARNDESSGWTDAKHARAIGKAARENGRSPAEVLAEIRARPYELGGAPPPRPVMESAPLWPTPSSRP